MKSITVYISILMIISSCQGKYYSEQDFDKIAKVDAHMHLFTGRTIFVEQAQKDNFRFITINVDHADSATIKEQVKNSLSAIKKYPETVFYSPTFFFDTAGFDNADWSSKAIEQLKQNISRGAVSVKLWKNIGMVVRDRNGRFIMVDDPKMDPVIDFVQKQGLPITGHLGEPRNCWLPLDKMTVSSDSSYFANNPQYHMFLHPEFPSYEAQVNARDNMLVKHPGLIFVGAHLGSLEWSVDELAKRLDKFPDMGVDLAERIVHFQHQSLTDYGKVRDFCIKYQDRILYATDMIDDGKSNPDDLLRHIHSTWFTDWKYFTTDEEMTSPSVRGKFKGLHLPKEVVKKIFSANAEKYYKLPVRE
jgi:predicted TIM-barrel fold metal-dependent hydrolase